MREHDPALLCYTSGTTGRPKGAVLSHANLVAATLSWIHEMRAGADDVWLSGQPLFHIGGINGMLPFLALGATSILLPTTGFDPGSAIGLIEEHAVTMCIFVPTQWDVVCASPAVARHGPRGACGSRCGARPRRRAATLELMGRTFPGAAIVSAYGQTEMSGATTLLKGADATRKMGSVGRADARSRAAGRRRRPPATWSPAWSGRSSTGGRWSCRATTVGPTATEEAFAGGWFHSGDLATRDEEGYLWLVDRKKDMIVSGGENVYPAEVERVLREHPAVADVAVIGVPHPRWVESPVAFVVRGRGAAARRVGPGRPLPRAARRVQEAVGVLLRRPRCPATRRARCAKRELRAMHEAGVTLN